MSCNLRKNIFEHYDMKIYLSYIVTVKIIIAKSRKMRRCPTAAVPSFHTPLNFMHQKCLHALRSVEFSYLNCLTACSVRISSTFFIFLFALNRSLTFYTGIIQYCGRRSHLLYLEPCMKTLRRVLMKFSLVRCWQHS